MLLKICKECLPYWPFESRVKQIVPAEQCECSMHEAKQTSTDDEVEHVTPDNATRVF